LKISIKVPDMNCQHWVMRIEKFLESLKDIQQTKVDLERKIVEVNGNVKIDEVKKAITAAGYRAEEIVNSAQ
jgi:copper chaperone CopZ